MGREEHVWAQVFRHPAHHVHHRRGGPGGEGVREGEAEGTCRRGAGGAPSGIFRPTLRGLEMEKRDSATRLGVWLWEWVKSISVALVVWFFLRTFLVEAFRIPSGSMENTLLVGDFLFVNKLLYGAEVPLVHKRLPPVREPRRGEILVFDSVEEEGLKVVKRLIGVPGDTLEMRESILYRNGKRVDEP